MQEEIVSGGISGAITDENSEKAISHAKKYYGWIRSSKTDCRKISENTGISVDLVIAIKNYLFVDDHEIYGDIRPFDPNFAIAESWRRLFEGKDIKPHDMTLLHHEIMEMNLISTGMDRDTAHVITSSRYNYKQESIDFYKNLREVSNG